MNNKIQAELAGLSDAFDRGESIFAIHYASGNFYLAKDYPVEVNCISIVELSELSTTTFSRANFTGDSPEEREKQLLNAFYDWLAEHQDVRIVHWNMNNSDYGFSAIASRYQWLFDKKPPATVPQARMTDLDSMIEDQYGEAYSPHPKLQSLAALNKQSQRHWLKGAEEPQKAADGDFSAVQRSTSEKARAVARLTQLLLSRSLVTQNSVGDITFADGRIDAVKTVLAAGERLLLVARSLKRRHSSRSTIELTDEYDIQDLLRSLLTVFFDDVREEATTPQYAAGSARIDFVLPTVQIAIEVKKSRSSMTSKILADELIIDRDRYAKDDRIGHLICLVFDHEGILTSPRGLESDLSRESSASGLAVTVKIVDR